MRNLYRDDQMSGTSFPEVISVDLFAHAPKAGSAVSCARLTDVHLLDEIQNEQTVRVGRHVVIVPDKGVGQHIVEMEKHEILPGSVLHILPGRAHRFLPDANFDGWVIAVDQQVCPAGLFDLAPTSPVVLLGQSIDVAKALVASLTTPEILPAKISHRLRLSLASVLLELIAGATDHTVLSPEVARDHKLVGDFRRELEFHYLSSRSVAEYSSLIGCSPKTLTRATKRVLGETPKEVIDARVANAACRLLAHTDLSVGWISYKLGFTEQSNFSKFFQRKVEMTPAAYRQSRQSG